MSGLEVDLNSSVIGTNGKAITGLYAAGELAGGIHGNNRLGGNSLLDCVGFDRITGKHATKHKLGASVKMHANNSLLHECPRGRLELQRHGYKWQSHYWFLRFGRAAGGIHDNNRLGHKPMLDCVYLVASLANLRRRPCSALT